MKQKNKQEDFFKFFWGILAAIILGNVLTEKGMIRAGEGVIWAGHNI